MDGIREKERQLIEEFRELDDSFQRYAYLIELSCFLPPLPEELKTEENLVEGCQSTVWLDISTEGGIFRFRSDSNTLIIRGVLYLLQELLNGQNVRDVAASELTFLRETGIMDNFESQRQKGIGTVIAFLRSAAAQAVDEPEQQP